MQKGIVQIYTGTGRGKTSAAIGLSVRAKSRGLRVLFAFMGAGRADEAALMEKLGITVIQMEPASGNETAHESVLKTLMDIKGKMRGYDLVVLDDLVMLTGKGILPEAGALTFIKEKPGETELVLTGEGASEGLMALAGLVTYSEDIKGPP